ncbi:CNNM domain-containing protein [Franzmannia qiaohouensis]|uniref:CNNM domain-containing protein n=1 Tax=Franzmannia qiaohouensis TaxID=1329370 RepID=A0ABU1HJD0_9GAMM|nr:CNNM domain-containing protein [Halomonas qiaohouensis]MDR5907406.1 CNNM domain-containing protein [Halomonas qiaohouensis]
MILLATIIVASLAISFLCSVLEAALLSLTPSYIARLKEDRPTAHAALAALKANIDRPLAAILTLNTIAHTAGATGVGAQVAVIFGETYIAVASAVMTLLILVLSEIIPKTLGATYWRQLAPFLPPLLRIMIVLLMPFIWLSERITRRLGKSEHDVDLRAEIKALSNIGLEERVLDPDESRTIINILNLHEMAVKDAMTPRTVCETVPPEMTVAEFDAQYGKAPYTRLPVMDQSEHAFGYVHRTDTYHADDAQTMGEIKRPIISIADTTSIEQVFSDMLRDHHHLRVVHDENGTWVGLITLEDIIETILGQDIVDETDDVHNLRQYAKQRWLKRLKHNASPR